MMRSTVIRFVGAILGLSFIGTSVSLAQEYDLTFKGTLSGFNLPGDGDSFVATVELNTAAPPTTNNVSLLEYLTPSIAGITFSVNGGVATTFATNYGYSDSSGNPVSDHIFSTDNAASNPNILNAIITSSSLPLLTATNPTGSNPVSKIGTYSTIGASTTGSVQALIAGQYNDYSLNTTSLTISAVPEVPTQWTLVAGLGLMSIVMFYRGKSPRKSF